MRTTVKLALHREIVGEPALTAHLTDDSTARYAVDWLGERYTELRPHLDTSAAAINREFADLSQRPCDGDEPRKRFNGRRYFRRHLRFQFRVRCDRHFRPICRPEISMR